MRRLLLCFLLFFTAFLSQSATAEDERLTDDETREFLSQVIARYTNIESYTDTGVITSFGFNSNSSDDLTSGTFRSVVQGGGARLIELRYERTFVTNDPSGYLGFRNQRGLEDWTGKEIDLHHSGDPFLAVDLTRLLTRLFRTNIFMRVTSPEQHGATRTGYRFPFESGTCAGAMTINGAACIGVAPAPIEEYDLTVYWIGRDDFLVRRIENAWGNQSVVLARELFPDDFESVLLRTERPVPKHSGGREIATIEPEMNVELTDEDFEFRLHPQDDD